MPSACGRLLDLEACYLRYHRATAVADLSGWGVRVGVLHYKQKFLKMDGGFCATIQNAVFFEKRIDKDEILRYNILVDWGRSSNVNRRLSRGAIAQLARALGSYPGRRRFEST